jgi:glycosyltransferase involved in cell wall biosynthesis
VQVVVIDDASREDIQSVASRFDVVYERLARNSGSSVARNRGVELASGRWLKFLDSDDVLNAGSLANEVAAGEASGAQIVAAGWQVVELSPEGIETPGPVFGAPHFDVIADDLLRGLAVPTSAALYSSELARRVSWDPGLSKLNDWDYFVSAAMQADSIATVPSSAYRWRQHQGERIVNTSSFLKNGKELFRILEKLQETLASRGALTETRKRRLAQYLYKEVRGAYRFDPTLGKAMLARILVLDPEFQPREEEQSAVFRFLGRTFPLHPVLSAYGVARRLLDRARAGVPR